MNGIDTEVWNPATDKLIDTKYTAEDLEGKFENKTELAKSFGMDADVDVPVIGMIGRMVEQKGYDILIESIEKLAAMNIQVVIMGEGEKKYATALEKVAKKHKNIGVKVGYEEELAHLIVAGSDMLLMPSKFEPCGLNQLYALAYGTIPIVHETGGLSDSVQEFNAKKGTGNGFVFSDHNSASMLEAIERALKLYEDEVRWEELQLANMSLDNSWKASAAQYVDELYRK
jgi:starch synthase